MAYKALYRTYRPQTFEDVAGQTHVTRTLQNAINEHKIGHAYLFAGPRGTGKTTIAKILAKALNCTGDNPPCGVCESCQAITLGEHPDVIEIDAASNNGVDEVRDLIDKVKYAPINGKYKVYIIDEVHMMSPGAWNALLKTLEEPPAHIVFIFATTEPHKILPTIISRCQRFDFKKVDDEDIVDRLKYVLNEENHEYEEDALYMIAKLADGGMRDALSITEQCLAYDHHLSVENINQVYGLLSNDKKIHLIQLLLTKDMKGVLKTLDQLLNSSIDIKRLTKDLIDVLKDIIIYKNTNDTDILSVLTKKDIDSIAPYILNDEAFDMIDIFMDASQRYNQTVDPSTYFELSLLKICNKVHDQNMNIERVIKEEPIIEEKVEPVSHTLEDDLDVLEEQPTEQLEQSFMSEPEIPEETLQEPIDIQQDDKPIVEEPEIVEDEPEEKEIPDNIEVDFNDILNILVQAKRPVLNDIVDKWSVIKGYCFNLNTAKYASMLCDGVPVAAGDDAFIITFKYQPEVNNVNLSQNYHFLKRFLKEVLGKEYDFVAVLEQDWPNIRNRFIELHRNQQLPNPQPVVLHHIDEEQVEKKKLNDAQKMAVDMFGDIVEFEE